MTLAADDDADTRTCMQAAKDASAGFLAATVQHRPDLLLLLSVRKNCSCELKLLDYMWGAGRPG
jgi:hypothetical protein